MRADDKLCVSIMCAEETGAGNQEFVEAEKMLRQSVESIPLSDVRYFGGRPEPPMFSAHAARAA